MAVGVILVSGFIRDADGEERQRGAQQVESGMRSVGEHAEAARQQAGD
jgi:hypothetical protein